jgi:hypothetical protein
MSCGSYNKHRGSNFYRYYLTGCELVRIIVSFCFSGDCLKREGEPLDFGQDFNLCSVESLRACEYMSLKNNCIVSPLVLQNSLVHAVHFTWTIQNTYN